MGSSSGRYCQQSISLESHDVRTWPHCSRLLSHSFASIGYAEEIQVAREETAHLLNQTAVICADEPSLVTQETVCTGAFYCGDDFWPESSGSGECCLQSRYHSPRFAGMEGARKYCERALRITEAAYGPVHQDVAATASNLGNVLGALGDLEGAREQFGRALR